MPASFLRSWRPQTRHQAGLHRHHHDIPSFLAHASRAGLLASSPTHIGTLYEYTVASALRRLGFELSRVGGRADGGIDLLGTWGLAGQGRAMPTLVQCKSSKRAAGPSVVRELEGAFAAAPAGWRGDGVVGCLVTTQGATRGVREAMGRSAAPLGFLKVDAAGRIEQMLWNRAVDRAGLEGWAVGLRHLDRGGKEVVLMRKGEVVEVGVGGEG
ncbi:MAG: hypothetical protein M1840_003810 [Geoglossum simile]|nr:MAG: hypothetical protein M1840_003810 [Geoglossum simile]